MGLEWFLALAMHDSMNASYIFVSPTLDLHVPCITSNAHEAAVSRFNALEKLRIGCWRSDAHSRGSENENP